MEHYHGLGDRQNCVVFLLFLNLNVDLFCLCFLHELSDTNYAYKIFWNIVYVVFLFAINFSLSWFYIFVSSYQILRIACNFKAKTWDSICSCFVNFLIIIHSCRCPLAFLCFHWFSRIYKKKCNNFEKLYACRNFSKVAFF